MTEPEQTNGHRDSPYFGLDYYTEEWGEWFFGRERETNRIITNLQAARLTLLHAESGVGKSSLVRAGVAWRLNKVLAETSPRRGTPRYVPIVFNSWKDDPIRSLVEGIAAAFDGLLDGRPLPELPADRLDRAIEIAAESAQAKLLIVLDQFEEYFLYAVQESPPQRFADQLARCINAPNFPANFLIVIREDAYAGLGDLFKRRIANIYGNFLHVSYLDRDDARDAIFGPLKVYNRQSGVEPVDIERSLVEAVLAQVPALVDPTQSATGNKPDEGADDTPVLIATPLLQLVMESIWNHERAAGSQMLRLSALEQLHGVENIVDSHLSRALSQLSEAEREVAIDCFKYLVTPSEGKIAESIPDLASRTSQDEKVVGTVLDKLDRERIVRSVPAAPGKDPMRFRRFEIFHDVLAGAINRAISLREEQRLLREKEEAEANARREEQRLLGEKQEAEERSRRDRQQRDRFRRLMFIAIALFAVALAVSIFAWNAWRSETSAHATVESQQLAAKAQSDLGSDPQLSLSYALRAMRTSPTSQAEEALLQAFQRAQVDATARAPGAVYDLAVSPSGRYVAAITNNTKESGDDLEIWDIRHGTTHVIPVTYDCSDALSPNGTSLVLACGDGNAYVYRFASGGASLQRKFGINGDNTPHATVSLNSVAFAGNNAFATVDNDGQVCLYTLLGAKQIPCSPPLKNPRYYRGKFALSSERFLSLNSVSVSPTEIVTTSTFSPTTNCPASATQTEPSLAQQGGCSQVMIWSLHQLSRPILSIPVPPSEAITTATFNQTGSEVVTSSQNGTARVWNVVGTTPAEIGNPLNTVGYTISAVFTQNDDVVTGNDDGQTTVWDPTSGEQVATLDCRCGVVYAIADDPADSNRIVTGSLDQLLRLWSISPLDLTETYALSTTGIFEAQYASPYVVAAVDANENVILWNKATNDSTSIPGIEASFEAKVIGQAAVVDRNGGVVEWTVPTGKTLFSQFADGTGVDHVALSPDGRFLAAAAGGAAIVVPYPSGYGATLVTPKAAGSGDIDSLTFNRSGTEVLAAYQNGDAVMWPTKVLLSHPHSGHPKSYAQCVFTVPDAANTVVYDAQFDASGTEVVTADNAGDAAVFSTRTCHQMYSTLSTSGQLNTASFDPVNSNFIVTASDDGTVRIWDVRNDLQVDVFGPLPGPLPIAENSAVFNAQGTQVLAAGNDGVLRFWSLKDGGVNITAVDQNAGRLEQIASQKITSISALEAEQH